MVQAKARPRLIERGIASTAPVAWIPAPGQAQKIAMMGSLDYARRNLIPDKIVGETLPFVLAPPSIMIRASSRGSGGSAEDLVRSGSQRVDGSN